MSNKMIKKAAACGLSAVMAFGLVAVTDAPKATNVQAASKKKVKTIKFKKSGYVLTRKGKKINLSKNLVFSPKKVNTKKVTYKSSNKKVATVSSKGIVTAKKKGTVTITAISKSNKKAKATTKITVGKVVTSLSFKEGKSKTLKEGASLTLHPKYKPSNASTKKVSYTSSNKKVATVSSKGKIKVVGAGTATITAKVKDAKGKTAKFKVNAPYVTKVTISGAKALEKRQTATLKAKTQGTTSNVKYVWSSSNKNVLKVVGNKNTAKVTAVSEGNATVKVEAYTKNNKKRRSATTKISVGMITAKTGVNTFTGNDNVVVPASRTGEVTIKNSKINKLILESGAYTVNLIDSTVADVEVVTKAANVTKAAVKIPVLNISGKSTVGKVNITEAVKVNVKDNKAEIKSVDMKVPAQIKAEVEDAKPIGTVAVKTEEPVKVEVPVTTLNIEAKAAVTVAAPVTKVAVKDQASVTVSDKVENLEVTAAGSKVQVEKKASVENVTIDVKDSVSEKTEITTKVGAEIKNVEIKQPTAIEVTGAGAVANVKVPETKAEADKTGVTITTPGTKVEYKDETPVNPDFVPVVNNNGEFKGITASADQYKIVKGENATIITKAQLDSALDYLKNPAKAYDRWVNSSAYTEYSGMVSVSGSGNTKTVTVNGTSEFAGTYKVTVTEVKAGTEYKVVAVKDGKDHNISVTVENGTITAKSARIEAVVAQDGTSFKATKDGEAWASAEKVGDAYDLTLPADKATGLEISTLTLN